MPPPPPPAMSSRWHYVCHRPACDTLVLGCHTPYPISLGLQFVLWAMSISFFSRSETAAAPRVGHHNVIPRFYE
jgi:hypothetical protein